MNVLTLHAHPKLTSASTLLDYVFLVLAIVLGAGSVLLLVVGESLGFTLRFVGWSEMQRLLWDALLSLFFFVQHSGMVRKSFRRQVTRIFPVHYDNAIYAIASGIALALVAVFWQRSETSILILQGSARTIVSIANLFGVLLFILGAVSLRPFDPLGLGPIRAHLRGVKYQPGPIIIRGPYRWMRHPLYAAVLLMFWANPDVTTDRLLFNVLWTVWICAATVLEERDLTSEFGAAYIQYKKTVPMLIPWKLPQPATKT
jgi:protein-S-isoprenylcysteine O-methyltransferase Ste14